MEEDLINGGAGGTDAGEDKVVPATDPSVAPDDPLARLDDVTREAVASELHIQERNDARIRANDEFREELNDIAERVVMDATRQAVHSGVYTSSNGIRITMKRVSRNLIVEAWSRVPEPKVPVVYLENKGREEQNPNDPDYLAALTRRQRQIGELTDLLYLTLGIDKVEITDDSPLLRGWASEQDGGDPALRARPWDDDAWVEEIMTPFELAKDQGLDEVVAPKIPERGKKTRLIAWLKYYALDNNEFATLSRSLMFYANSAIKEDDVASATRSFRSEAGGENSHGMATAVGSQL